MGVAGLWTLLGPVGRPVQLENMEGKRMAIDSSIWLYQFQATMRDKDGRALVNAHILGFLRRISKLLFYGIRPVFVFDGGAPALKKSTINERKKKKAGAALSYARTAEKILAAQMRREALNRREQAEEVAAEAARNTNRALLADAVYQEDLEGSAPPVISTKDKGKQREVPLGTPPEPSPKKNKWHDHDPYRLPELSVLDAAAKAANGALPDPRLATEDELRAFIDEMVPEDFDTNSEAFRSLPTEAQYEIIGDLRLKSRQTSYARLESMLASAPTALDFSKAQIVNLKQRNTLTQKLLATVETVGKVRYTTIPTRIASERNRQYVLVRNEAAHGGWVLGIRDEGTAAKPINVDKAESDDEFPMSAVRNSRAPDDDSDDDDDMEEILPTPAPTADPDLLEHRRSVTLGALAHRKTDKQLAPLRTRLPLSRPRGIIKRASGSRTIIRQPSREPVDDSRPLFLDEEDEDADEEPLDRADDEENDDAALQIALQQSIADDEQREAEELSRALSESAALHAEFEKEDLATARQFHSSRASGYSGSTYVTLMSRVNGPAAKFAAVRSAAMGETQPESPNHSPNGRPHPSPLHHHHASPSNKRSPSNPSPRSSSSPVRPKLSPSNSKASPLSHQTSGSTEKTNHPLSSTVSAPAAPPRPPVNVVSDDEDMEEYTPSSQTRPLLQPLRYSQSSNTLSVTDPESKQPNQSRHFVSFAPTKPTDAVGSKETAPAASTGTTEVLTEDLRLATRSHLPTEQLASSQEPIVVSDEDQDMEEIVAEPLSSVGPPTAASLPAIAPAEPLESTSPTHSPPRHSSSDPSSTRPGLHAAESSELPVENAEEHTNDFDAAEEMDVSAEQDQFASFYSQIQKRSVDQLRSEIDSELKALQAQKKAAMRDSEDITQQMVGQIQMMLRLFGIPYVTAPMEAEAQCAKLVEVGLVEGIITDDSDVFLFGGQRVFRNMFNQSKTVECFLLVDLARELGLDRDTLVRLAYLLGSDYTDGVPGVGPVLAMELLKEFPGEEGLHRFKDWWRKVQSGRDSAEESGTPFRKRFKKKFKDLHLTDDWPPGIVRDAYYHPTVDESEEPFKWGLPDLDALRQFLNAELGWSSQKVDDTLLPIIHKVGQRGKPGNANKQSTMESYFDASIGSGTFAPRKRAPYASKRLQKVVADFRKQQKSQVAGEDEESSASSSSSDEATAKAPRKAQSKPKAKPKPKRAKEQPSGASEASASTSTSAARGAKRKATSAKAKKPSAKKRKTAAVSSSDEELGGDDQSGPSVVPDRPLEVKLRPRPKPKFAAKPTADTEPDNQE